MKASCQFRMYWEWKLSFGYIREYSIQENIPKILGIKSYNSCCLPSYLDLGLDWGWGGEGKKENRIKSKYESEEKVYVYCCKFSVSLHYFWIKSLTKTILNVSLVKKSRYE
jgi:hypothetical protein